MVEVSPQSTPETAFLLRLRSWRDALPWLPITEALRPAASVLSLALVGLGFLFTQWIQPRPSQVTLLPTPVEHPFALFDSFRDAGGRAVESLLGPAFRLWAVDASWLERGSAILQQIALLLVWSVIGGYLTRQGGLSFAGRPCSGLTEGLQFAGKRASHCLAIVAMVLVGIALIALYSTTCVFVAKVPAVGYYLSIAMQVLGIPLILVGGLLTVASCAAIPLGWAGVMLEEDGSCFDGISRGFEYVLRRPLTLLLYLTIAAIVVFSLTSLASLACHAAGRLVLEGAGWAGQTDSKSMAVISAVLDNGPAVALLSQCWCLLGWIYLLMRRSANYQEIEDVWEPTRSAAEPLPELKLTVDEQAAS